MHTPTNLKMCWVPLKKFHVQNQVFVTEMANNPVLPMPFRVLRENNIRGMQVNVTDWASVFINIKEVVCYRTTAVFLRVVNSWHSDCWKFVDRRHSLKTFFFFFLLAENFIILQSHFHLCFSIHILKQILPHCPAMITLQSRQISHPSS